MKIVRPSFEILSMENGEDILKRIELAGKTCYKSENKITKDSAKDFVAHIIKLGHESVLEHASISVRIICDRAVAMEWVRHRIAAYSMESSRFCNYSKEKFNGELTFIRPCFWEEGSENYKTWEAGVKIAEDVYMTLIRDGATPEQARTVLPQSTKTELVCTMNLRAWRNFFNLRALGKQGKPHPQIKEIAVELLKRLSEFVPVVFDDLVEKCS